MMDNSIQLPRMCNLRQCFDGPTLEDIPGTVQEQLQALDLKGKVKAGQTVAIPAGSRGIANMTLILREAVRGLKSLGLEPFIVPAMGSHGGGTAEGQLAVLQTLGITEASVEAPIRATMETVVVTQTDGGVPVHFDRFAFEADHVLVAGRIKPHTRFVGPVESGLHKMMLIGLGNHLGAQAYHSAILGTSFDEIIRSVSEKVLQECRVLGGLAILENQRDETAMIEGVAPGEFAEREAELLTQATEWLPRLPFPDVDLLIVDQIGKNISGSGMDAGVVGRKFNEHAATDRDMARCKRILVRSITKESQGNATGIGMAHFTTEACVKQIDLVKTGINCSASSHPELAMIPIALPTDKEAVCRAIQTIGQTLPEHARVIHIQDTLHLEHTRVSEAYFEEAAAAGHLELLGDPYDFPVKVDGSMAAVAESFDR